MLSSRRAVIAIERLLFVVAGAAMLIAFIDWWFGGYEFYLFGVRLASRHALKPARLSLQAASVGALVVVARHVQPLSVPRKLVAMVQQVRLVLRVAWSWLEAAAPWLAGLTALMALAFGITFGTHAAGGSDSYGYVSQATLWSNGSLHVRQPLATIAPWPNADWTLAPLGYRPATTPGAIVPIYSPGLPMVMALLAKIGGPSAVYLAVPALGALAVWCTFVVGRKLGGPATGLLAAILVAASPVFLVGIVAPMSDVAVTGWWMAAIAVAASGSRASAAGAGVAAAAALLTRPNLLPLGLTLGGFVALTGGTSWRTRAAALILFAVGFVPGCLAVAWIFDTLYGSPLVSGYGRVEHLFRMTNIVPNLQLYPAWVVNSETPFICLGLAAPALFWQHTKTDRGLIWFSLAWIAVVLACYLPYMQFNHWMTIRFLLPGLPVAVLLSSAVTIALIRRLPAGLRLTAFLGVCLLIVPMYIDGAARGLAFDAWIGDRRVAETARYVERNLPRNAVAFASFHSGSVRHYAQRQTIFYPWFAPEWLDRGLAFLRDRGDVPYIVLEDWELPLFRTQFAKHSVIGALDWPPVAEIEGEPTHVLVYDPRDRDRHMAGEHLATVRVPVKRN